MKTPIELVQEALRPHVDIDVVFKVPIKRPTMFIRVDQAAPQVLSPAHQRVQVMIQCYGDNVDEVIDRAYTVRRILEDIDIHHPKALGAEDIRGPEEFPDPDIPEVNRWQVTGIIYMTLG